MSDDISQIIRISGDVGAPVFAVWIARHARRLGLRGAILRHGVDRLDLALTGQPELLDAMALGCSLGPREVWVDQIERWVGQPQNTDDFSSMSD